MCEGGTDVLRHSTAIPADFEDRCLLMVRVAARHPGVEGFDPVHLASREELIEGAIDRHSRRHAIVAEIIQDLVGRQRFVLTPKMCEDAIRVSQTS